MRVMVIVKASQDSEAGIMPSQELMTAMGNYNEELVKAGIMEGGDGLKPTSNGARVGFVGDDRPVIKGPFRDTGDLVAGFWIWKVDSLDEAIDWAKRAPNPMPGTEGELEIRPFYEIDDFSEEFTPELREQEERLRRDIDARQGSSDKA